MATAGFTLIMASLIMLQLLRVIPGGRAIIFLLSMLTAIAGTIVSGVGFSQINKAPDTYSNRWMALAGLIIGASMLVLVVAMFISILLYF